MTPVDRLVRGMMHHVEQCYCSCIGFIRFNMFLFCVICFLIFFSIVFICLLIVIYRLFDIFLFFWLMYMFSIYIYIYIYISIYSKKHCGVAPTSTKWKKMLRRCAHKKVWFHCANQLYISVYYTYVI